MRTKKEIEELNNGITSDLSSGDVKELQNTLILEVLLDIRDLLKEANKKEVYPTFGSQIVPCCGAYSFCCVCAGVCSHTVLIHIVLNIFKHQLDKIKYMTNITYELAKKLKDAGYPQGDWDNSICQHPTPKTIDEDCAHKMRTDCEVVYLPTLSELIKECGEIYETKIRVTNDEHKIEIDTLLFFNLRKFYNGVNKNGIWRASFQHDDIPRTSWIIGNGETPEIAVANLWLELNKK